MTSKDTRVGTARVKLSTPVQRANPSKGGSLRGSMLLRRQSLDPIRGHHVEENVRHNQLAVMPTQYSDTVRVCRIALLPLLPCPFPLFPESTDQRLHI